MSVGDIKADRHQIGHSVDLTRGRILIIFSHILTLYTQIERKNRCTFKKAKLFTSVFKIPFFTLTKCFQILLSGTGAGQDWTGSTTPGLT